MRYLIFIFLFSNILLFISSCNNSASKRSQEYPARLVKAKELIQFELDDSTSFDNNNLVVSNYRNEEVLVVESKHKNSIQYYSISERRKVKEIKFSKEGENPIFEIHGFTIINQDSIIVYDKYKANAFLVNSEGIVIEKIKLTDNRLLNHASMTRLPNVLIDNKLCMFIFPQTSIDEDNFFDGDVKFELVYDLQTGYSYYVDFSWPEIYQSRKWTFFHTFPSRIKGKNNKLIYSFGADHYIYELSLSGDYRKHLAKSDHFEEIESLSVGEDETESFLKNGVYGMIIYDPYRDVYYRIVGVKTNPLLPDGRKKSASYKQYGVIILDSNFNKIGETLLDPLESFRIKDWFVCEQGLCISTANYLNKNINEDLMEFNILQLVYE
ncbi:MAG TPA: DUF4221 family protein [Cyclobacteriaceae bacterium]|nr:DUF4221 family protein [Cyclobacteriaceae bacterium]